MPPGVYGRVQVLHTIFVPNPRSEPGPPGAAPAEIERTRCILAARVPPRFGKMLRPVIVVHYHELWLKGRNRKFFLGKFLIALRQALSDFPGVRMRQPGDRVVIEFGPEAPMEKVVARMQRVLGVA